MGRGPALSSDHRMQILTMKYLEWSYLRIAKNIKHSLGSVRDYMKALDSEGFRKRSGRTPKFPVHTKRKLVRYVHEEKNCLSSGRR